jgi:hypothetical protein
MAPPKGFPPGTSGNPKGRPRGNIFQRLAPGIVTEEVAEKIIRSLAIRAAAGNAQAASILLDFFPRSSFAVARIGPIRSPADAADAAAKIARSIVNGNVDADTGNNAITALQSAASLLMVSDQLASLWAKIAMLEARSNERDDLARGEAMPWNQHNGRPHEP